MNWKIDIEPKVVRLQHELQQTMRDVEKLSNENELLPDLNNTYHVAYDMLQNNEYNVVVCGEVKKGKSSLLNAIIGQDILPVYSEIATSQVFRICNSNTESFELVFTNGTREPINKEQLAYYGSQVEANLKGEATFNGRSLDYIQIYTPISFLPNGVNLVDTPGLGALYKSHEWITQNYVSKAAAVLFVLDPERPIVEQEKKFINKVLDITPYILFVMTKIDMYSEDVVQSILNRDEELLTEIYKERNWVSPQIHPISSITLMKASTGRIAALRQGNYDRSNFPVIYEQLMFMILRAVGLLRTGIAMTELVNHINKTNSLITDMLNATQKEAKAIHTQFEKQKDEIQSNLQSQWGGESHKRNTILNEITAICNSTTSRVQQIVSTSGDIYKEYEEKITALTNMDDLKHLCSTLPNDLLEDVDRQWKNINNEICTRVDAVLSEVQTSMDQAYSYHANGTGYLDLPPLSTSDISIAVRTGIATFTISGTVLGALGILSIPVVGPIAFVGAAVMSWFVGKDTILEKNKQNMKRKLSEVMNALSIELLHVKPGENYSIVKKFENDVKNNASDAITRLFESKKQAYQQELDQLVAQSQLSVKEKQAEYEKWLSIRTKWNAETEKAKALLALRKDISSALN